MSFNEFILAVGEKGLHEALRSQDYELINAYAGKYTDLLKKYYYVGGMPEVVQTYIDSDDLLRYVRSKTIFCSTMKRILANMRQRKLFRAS